MIRIPYVIPVLLLVAGFGVTVLAQPLVGVEAPGTGPEELSREAPSALHNAVTFAKKDEESTSGDHGGEGHGKDSGEDHEKSAPWGELAIHFTGFLILIGLYFGYVHEPAKKGLANRKEQIQSSLKNARENLEEAKKEYHKMEEKLENIEEAWEAEREKLLQQGRDSRDEIIEEAEKQASERIEKARDQAKLEEKRARVKLEREFVDRAFALIETYFRQKSNGQIHSRLTDDFLSSLKEADHLGQFTRGSSFANFTGSSNDSDLSSSERGSNS